MNHVNGLFEFIKKSPSAYHAVNTVKETLDMNGYTELYEGGGVIMEYSHFTASLC